MTAKCTTEQFIESAKAIHGDAYDYSKVVYVSSAKKVEVVCKVGGHGSFWVQPQSHKTCKTGCPQCARIRTIAGKALTQEKFIERSMEKHGNRYDYSQSVYSGSNKNVTIICNDHGPFEQTAHSHMTGHGCTQCAIDENTKRQSCSTESFVTKAKTVHGDKYDYNSVEYVSSQAKVKILCNIHKTFFWQDPSNHIQGAGCPHCGKSGFNRNKPASLYILRCDNITKVGITNVAVTKRLKQLSGSSKHAYTIFHSQYFELGENALNLETKTLQYLKGLYKQPEDKFQGSTECFFDVNIEELMQFVSPQAVTI